MRSTTFFLALFGCFGPVKANYGKHLLGSPEQHQDMTKSVKLDERMLSLSTMMMPGDRVSAIDRDTAICTAEYNSDPEVAIKRTVIDYYYAIESTKTVTTENAAGRSMIRMLEDKLFIAIRPAILWCYFDERPLTRRDLLGIDSSFIQGETFRKLSLEEARRLSIVSFSNRPEDKEMSLDCNFPTQDDSYCVVMHGRVTIMHHETSDVSLAIASIYDSTQKAMDNSEIFLDLEDDENTIDIINIEWLGETQQDAINGGPNGNGMVAIGEPNPTISEVSEQEEERSIVAYALSIPILILMASALLLAKNKKKRRAMTKQQIFGLASFQNVLIGTGDPPDSFHEGMYHYTGNGVRYLSTNCPHCIETKQNGFFTAGDLDTIAELSLDDDCDNMSHRKKILVSPSVNALGVKHSSIDVHSCSSARCSICTYKPRGVEFISKSEDFKILNFGEGEV